MNAARASRSLGWPHNKTGGWFFYCTLIFFTFFIHCITRRPGEHVYRDIPDLLCSIPYSWPLDVFCFIRSFASGFRALFLQYRKLNGPQRVLKKYYKKVQSCTWYLTAGALFPILGPIKRYHIGPHYHTEAMPNIHSCCKHTSTCVGFQFY